MHNILENILLETFLLYTMFLLYIQKNPEMNIKLQF
jgi:hypothetical protein